MFTSLAIFSKTNLILIFPCGNDKSSVICASCTHYHIRNIVFVTWGIKQSELFRFCLEIGTTDFNSFTFGLLYIRGVHEIGEPPRVTTVLLCLVLELFNGALVDQTHLDHEVPTNSRLTCL